MRAKMKKKAYFFLMDAFFAIVILTVGFMLISSNKAAQTTEIPMAAAADNLVSILATARVQDLCPGNCNSCQNEQLVQMCDEGAIKNYNQSLLDYFGELYKNEVHPPDSPPNYAYLTNAQGLFDSLLEQYDLYRSDLFGIEFRINDEVIFAESDSTKEKSKDLLSAKRVIFGFYEIKETGEVVFWGPYLAEVNIWQK
jgi:hypothetical protein